MSHITKINLLVKDLGALDKACQRLGLELVREQKTFAGYTMGKCEHAIRVKGQPFVQGHGTYEIGLVKRADGKGYELKWDGHMGTYAPAAALYEKVGYEGVGGAGYIRHGANASKLLDWYAAEVARKQMAKQGFMVRTVQQDRKVLVTCAK